MIAAKSTRFDDDSYFIEEVAARIIVIALFWVYLANIVIGQLDPYRRCKLVRPELYFPRQRVSTRKLRHFFGLLPMQLACPLIILPEGCEEIEEDAFQIMRISRTNRSR